MTYYIYLNGTSSSGKSTIAKAICAQQPNAHLVSADDFGDDFNKYIDPNCPIYLDILQQYEDLEEKIKICFNPQAKLKLFDDYYQLLNDSPLPKEFNSDLNMYDYLDSLNGHKDLIIVDDLISTPFLYEKFKLTFSNKKVFLVHITCQIDELQRREKKRGDRLIGMAEYWQEKVNFIKDYNLCLESSSSTPENIAKKILLAAL